MDKIVRQTVKILAAIAGLSLPFLIGTPNKYSRFLWLVFSLCALVLVPLLYYLLAKKLFYRLFKPGPKQAKDDSDDPFSRYEKSRINQLIVTLQLIAAFALINMGMFIIIKLLPDFFAFFKKLWFEA